MASASRCAEGVDALGRDDPPAEVRRPPLAGERLEVRGRDRSPLGDDALDRSVGPGLAHRADGRDLDDLAAADGLGPTALAKDEAIAGEKRHRLRNAHAHPSLAAGCDRVAADHAQLDRMLA